MKKFDRLIVGFIAGVIATSLLFVIRAIKLPTVVFWLFDLVVMILAYFCASLISRPDYKGTKIQDKLLNLSNVSISSKETRNGIGVAVSVPESLMKKDPKNVQNIMISVGDFCNVFEKEELKKPSSKKSTSKKSIAKKTSNKKVKK